MHHKPLLYDLLKNPALPRAQGELIAQAMMDQIQLDFESPQHHALDYSPTRALAAAYRAGIID